MTEKEIIHLLKNQNLEKKSLALKLQAVTAQAKEEMETLLTRLQFSGVVGCRNNSYFLLEEQGILLCKVSLKKRNFVVLNIIPSNEEIKISGEESDGLLVGDYIYVKKIQGDYHGIDYLKPVDSFKGRYSLSSNGKEQLLVDYLNQCGKTILISSMEEDLVGKVNQGDLVVGQILSLHGSTYTVKLTKLLVKASNVGSDISMIILANDAPLDFPQEVLDEAKNIPETLSEDDYLGREDYREETVVTIDGNDAHDFDDAVSGRRVQNGYEIKVHIADVTHYVKPNHPLDNEAINRGTSIYVADRVVPMLPFELSNGICSLNPNVERLTLTVIMLLDARGNVFSSRVVKSVIRSHARLTYDGVNAFFEGKECDYSDEIKETLTVLHDCATTIRKRREKQGSMKLSSTEIKFTLDEKGMPIDVKKMVQGESEKLIEDLMIIANCEVAKQLKNHHIPVLYRIHEFPPLSKLTQFKDFIRKMDPKLMASFPRTSDISGARLNDFLASIPKYNLRDVISYMMLRAMAKAKYSPEEVGHFGLAEPYYCHFTSPIRRYPDDIIHRLVKDYLIDGKSFDKDSLDNYLADMGDRTSSYEARADMIEREVNDLEAAKYMSQHIGEQYKAKVTGLVQRGMFVETEIGIEGFLPYRCMHGDVFFFDEKTYSAMGKHHPDLSFTIGNSIDVKVLVGDIDKEEVTFATPLFYDRNAVDLSEEDRKDMALNGLHIYEEEEDFHPMTGRPTLRSRDNSRSDRYEDRDRRTSRSRDDRESRDSYSERRDTRRNRYEEDAYSSPREEVSISENTLVLEEKTEERKVRGSGYSGKKKAATTSNTFEKEGKSFRPRKPKDDRGFDSQVREFDDGSSKKRERKKTTFEDHKGYASKPVRRRSSSFENEESRDSYKKEGGRSSYRSKERDGKRSYRKNDSSERRSYSKRDSFKKEGGRSSSYSKSPRSSQRRSSNDRYERKSSSRSYNSKDSHSSSYRGERKSSGRSSYRSDRKSSSSYNKKGSYQRRSSKKDY